MLLFAYHSYQSNVPGEPRFTGSPAVSVTVWRRGHQWHLLAYGLSMVKMSPYQVLFIQLSVCCK